MEEVCGKRDRREGEVTRGDADSEGYPRVKPSSPGPKPGSPVIRGKGVIRTRGSQHP
jgi:hypothetical protein